jgi:hypothetical protein
VLISDFKSFPLLSLISFFVIGPPSPFAPQGEKDGLRMISPVYNPQTRRIQGQKAGPDIL